MSAHGPLRVGVGGPVGAGKTALMDALCRRLSPAYEIAAITNDIYTTEDARLPQTGRGRCRTERILGRSQTGACPHTAIRDDISSINLDGRRADLEAALPCDLDLDPRSRAAATT